MNVSIVRVITRAIVPPLSSLTEPDKTVEALTFLDETTEARASTIATTSKATISFRAANTTRPFITSLAGPMAKVITRKVKAKVKAKVAKAKVKAEAKQSRKAKAKASRKAKAKASQKEKESLMAKEKARVAKERLKEKAWENIRTR